MYFMYDVCNVYLIVLKNQKTRAKGSVIKIN